MKTILFVIGSLGGGGAERVISILSRALLNTGTQVAILSLSSAKQAYNYDSRISIYTLKKNRRKVSVITRPFRIRKIIKSIAPEVVVSFVDQVNIQVSFAFLCMKNKPILVLCERNDPVWEPSSKLMRIVRDRLYKTGNAFVFQTEKQREYFAKITKNKPSLIVQNPIVSDLPSYNGNNSTFFVAAGRLTEQKNYRMMINSFKKVVEDGYEYKLFIYGDGPQRQELEELISKEKLSDFVLIKPFSSSIHSVMAESKGFLMTSDYEGVSNSMLEAMRIGVPIISTNYPSGGAEMYIKNDQTGHLVECNDISGFAVAIEDLIDNYSKAIEMAQRGVEQLRNHTPERVSKEWESFIDSIIKGKQKA